MWYKINIIDVFVVSETNLSCSWFSQRIVFAGA